MVSARLAVPIAATRPRPQRWRTSSLRTDLISTRSSAISARSSAASLVRRAPSSVLTMSILASSTVRTASILALKSVRTARSLRLSRFGRIDPRGLLVRHACRLELPGVLDRVKFACHDVRPFVGWTCVGCMSAPRWNTAYLDSARFPPFSQRPPRHALYRAEPV